MKGNASISVASDWLGIFQQVESKTNCQGVLFNYVYLPSHTMAKDN
jgi:hypothetical protein